MKASSTPHLRSSSSKPAKHSQDKTLRMSPSNGPPTLRTKTDPSPSSNPKTNFSLINTSNLCSTTSSPSPYSSLAEDTKISESSQTPSNSPTHNYSTILKTRLKTSTNSIMRPFIASQPTTTSTSGYSSSSLQDGTTQQSMAISIV